MLKRKYLKTKYLLKCDNLEIEEVKMNIVEKIVMENIYRSDSEYDTTSETNFSEFFFDSLNDGSDNEEDNHSEILNNIKSSKFWNLVENKSNPYIYEDSYIRLETFVAICVLIFDYL